MKSPISTERKSNNFTLSDLKIILLGGKRWMLTVGLIVSVAMFVNWELLVSIGAASVILAVAPCLVMCGLGLCMNRSSCKKAPSEDTDS